MTAVLNRRADEPLAGASNLKIGVLNECGFPLVVEPAGTTNSAEFQKWIEENRSTIEASLLNHGAILFRGFPVGSPGEFACISKAFSDQILDYVERAAPRKVLGDRVFTSTEYPAGEWIPMHHEMSYSHNWPVKIMFYCDIPAKEKGYTPIADDRLVFPKIPESIKQKFIEKKVMYVRNFGEGVDMSWQETFQTSDKSDVEAYLKKTNTHFEWLSEDRLRTRQVRQALATHPKTGDTVWFNHAHLFHMSNMPAMLREALLEEFKEDELPRNAFYGDGSSLEDETVAFIRDLYLKSSIQFTWQKGDILLLDNFLVSHGRSPFVGPRKICVAMAELYTHPDFR